MRRPASQPQQQLISARNIIQQQQQQLEPFPLANTCIACAVACVVCTTWPEATRSSHCFSKTSAYWLIDWLIELRFYIELGTKRSVWRRFSQPVCWWSYCETFSLLSPRHATISWKFHSAVPPTTDWLRLQHDLFGAEFDVKHQCNQSVNKLKFYWSTAGGLYPSARYHWLQSLNLSSSASSSRVSAYHLLCPSFAVGRKHLLSVADTVLLEQAHLANVRRLNKGTFILIISPHLLTYIVWPRFISFRALWLVAATANLIASRRTTQFAVTATSQSALTSDEISSFEMRSHEVIL